MNQFGSKLMMMMNLFKCQETLRTTNITNILFTVYKISEKKKKHAS